MVNRKTLGTLVDGNKVKLVGDPTLARSMLSLQAMIRTLKKERGGLWVVINRVEGAQEHGEKQLVSEVPATLESLREEYVGVFTTTGLPPARGHKHAIVLKVGSNSVSVRPYRYPHFQKDEIEKLIQEMLAAEIIKVSSSPFSSLVLLVKKKDGSWHFCVDYWTLNKETAPDKYPILVIDELLDEVHGSTIFS